MRNWIEICEELGWNVTIDGDVVEFQQESPHGEDFSFAVNKNSIAKNVFRYAENFDIDAHVLMWLEAKRNGVSGVPGLVELVEDAQEIQKMLDGLSDALKNCESEEEKR